MAVNPRLKRIWVRTSAAQVVSVERLRKFNFSIFHLEITSGCESEGFQLGLLGLQKFLWLLKNVRTPSILTCKLS